MADGAGWGRACRAKAPVRLHSTGEGRNWVRNWRNIGTRREDRAGTNLKKK